VAAKTQSEPSNEWSSHSFGWRRPKDWLMSGIDWPITNSLREHC